MVLPMTIMQLTIASIAVGEWTRDKGKRSTLWLLVWHGSWKQPFAIAQAAKAASQVVLCVASCPRLETELPGLQLKQDLLFR